MIRISGLNKSFSTVNGQLQVLHDIELHVEPGQRIAVAEPESAAADIRERQVDAPLIHAKIHRSE